MSAAAITLAPLAIPSKSRPDALYPSSPLKVFPPPAPIIRQPLRERCGVSLTLHIDNPALAFKSSKVPGPWSPKGHLQPHRNHLPRRRNPKTCFANFHDKQPAPAAPELRKPARAPLAQPLPYHTPAYAFNPPKSAEPRLQEIIPALWVAFAQEDRSYEDGFTHVVEIAYAATATIERSWVGSVQRLHLTLPESERKPKGRAALALTDAQLRGARDFIAECMPQSIAAMPEQSAIRVLIVTPHGRPTDAMALVGCYLSFVADQGTEAILRCIDEEESVLSVWKGEVSGDEIERVEKIARSWSWLSAIVPAAKR